MADVYNYGMIGLGTMGLNLVLNMADNGFTVAGYDKDPAAVKRLNEENKKGNVKGFEQLNDFVHALEKPRTVMLLVPAGKIVDYVISDLKPLLEKNDIIIDCGNSHFTDTARRVNELEPLGIHYMGMGISGGETGARFGPSIMPGGDEVAYKRIAPMLQKVSAKVNDEPCTAYMGKGAAGHYVKMVHNGIEYALMQLISETYHVLKYHGNLSNAELHEVFSKWNKGPLKSFLIEITAAIFNEPDTQSAEKLIDKILDTAKQKGTGAWTSQDAMNIGAPVPVIDAAVSQRILSSLRNERIIASKFADRTTKHSEAPNKDTLIIEAEQALYTAFILTYAQGLAMLQVASKEYGFGTDIETVAKIWRGGCIIRAALLGPLMDAYASSPNIQNVLLYAPIMKPVKTGESYMRRFIIRGIQQFIPLPAYCAALNYLESYCSAWLPANLIQAQRDFFGAHTYQRTDVEGTFHTEWQTLVQ